ncbi:prepilin peptidase dependent protein B [Vespertiliibacter pulmonis]|uniref:Prepilin peptidase dependent protein B n=2 Tax=Vespertiliibacter pulmonis TaxID=1443036 RepID=A0A3N4VPN5_9PAST|nr:prepilin peptidase dependent protein B [Vespertiliibacter pulmonis]
MNKYSGFTLIEMIISLSLSVLLFFVCSYFYTNIYSMQNKQRELLNLQQTTQQLLNYFQQHIQHSGYQGPFRTESNYDSFLIDGKAYYLGSPHCFLFLYDLNQDGCIGSRNKKQPCIKDKINNTKDVKKELFGIKFESKQISFFDDKAIDRCYSDHCNQWAKSCELNLWRKAFELSDYTVDNLSFKWIVSDKLLAIGLTLRSNKMKNISYQETAYSYLLNR